DRSAVLATTSRQAFVRTPTGPAARPGAVTVAAVRVGEGLVVVISRHALGALGPQYRATTMPPLQHDALKRTRDFLIGLARWTRRPAEWAHVPAAAHGIALALAQAPAPFEWLPPRLAPPEGVTVTPLPLQPAGLERCRHAPTAPERRVDPRLRPPRRPRPAGRFVARRPRRRDRDVVRPRFAFLEGHSRQRLRDARPPRRRAARPGDRPGAGSVAGRRRRRRLHHGSGILRCSLAAYHGPARSPGVVRRSAGGRALRHAARGGPVAALLPGARGPGRRARRGAPGPRAQAAAGPLLRVPFQPRARRLVLARPAARLRAAGSPPATLHPRALHARVARAVPGARRQRRARH